MKWYILCNIIAKSYIVRFCFLLLFGCFVYSSPWLAVFSPILALSFVKEIENKFWFVSFPWLLDFVVLPKTENVGEIGNARVISCMCSETSFVFRNRFGRRTDFAFCLSSNCSKHHLKKEYWSSSLCHPTFCLLCGWQSSFSDSGMDIGSNCWLTSSSNILWKLYLLHFVVWL